MRVRVPTAKQAKPASGASDDPLAAAWVIIADGLARELKPGGRMVVGSSPACDLVLDNRHVSGRHCELRAVGRALQIRDLDSTNGTWLGATRVSLHRTTAAAVVRCGGRALLLGRRHGRDALGALRWCGMIGRDPLTFRVWERLAAAAGSDSPAWLLGESGVGKERAARALHQASARADGPWVALNCAALPDDIAEAELFGVTRGAFTGADRDRRGAFGRADGGTLLLDEIGELSARVQAKLLRVLETGEVRPVGGDRSCRVDVRVVTATWRDLEAAAALGSFRHDLLHRLWVLRVDLPPLRDRRGDIAPLLDHLLTANNADDLWPDPPLLRAIEDAPWPGNVRQLNNHALRATVSGDPRDLLPPELAPRCAAQLLGRRNPRPAIAQRLIRAALREHGGNRTAAARALGVSRSTLYRWMRQRGGARPPALPAAATAARVGLTPTDRRLL